MQIFFLNNPNIDFNLVGVVDLLDMPGLSDLLRRIIVEQIAAFMVGFFSVRIIGYDSFQLLISSQRSNI